MKNTHLINTLSIAILSITGLFSSSVFSKNSPENVEYHLSAHLGGGMTPVYTGASKYTYIPVFGATAEASFERWGTFSANESGLSWLSPIDGPFNIALIIGYDKGRDEKIKTSDGDNNDLKGMGKLKSSPEVGVALIYREGPYHLYLKGLKAVTRRDYGGEELGYTSRAELGGEFSYSLTDAVSGSFEVMSTWGDRKYLQGHFGVTRQQARDSQFQYYKPGSGIQDIAYHTTINYQFTSSFALHTTVGGYYLVGDAGRSPLTKSRTGVVAGMAISYTF